MEVDACALNCRDETLDDTRLPNHAEHIMRLRRDVIQSLANMPTDGIVRLGMEEMHKALHYLEVLLYNYNLM